MNIAVTGGAGFIGSHIVDAYIEAGHKVVIIDDMSSGVKANINPNATFYKMSIGDKKIFQLLSDEKVEVLNHHAAQISVRVSVEDPKHDAQINILDALNLYEAARMAGVRRIIFASSGGAIYGEQEYFPADEKHSKRPLSPYGVSKLANEKYLGYYKAVYGIENVIFRYTNVYGPRQNPHGEAGVVAIFTMKMLKGEQPIINGDGTQTRDYVYVSDVARANLLALNENARGIYNVSTGIEYSVNTLFQLLQMKIGKPFKRQYGPAKAGEQKRSVCTSSKMKNLLQWQPEVDFEKGLGLTVEWFKAHTK
ncbi:MAG: NAD-dependent epimerase/dehydratase family protein [Bacteroidota bacterium]|nr:NAD-dependent epimerase/dehydratase family protein [Candidatus Kapabacteria bacterium]MDW8220479.1 NAD-dependent epimerase/dehydratase family protein [Bacteroidota bacterium]